MSIQLPIGSGADFSNIVSEINDGDSRFQEDLELYLRVCDVAGVISSLNLGAKPKASYIESAIEAWQKSNENFKEWERNSLFINRSFLPILNLFQGVLPELSLKALETLHDTFRTAYFDTRYGEVLSRTGKKSSPSVRTHFYCFLEHEYQLVDKLFFKIREIYGKKMRELWSCSPSSPCDLKVVMLSSLYHPYKGYECDIILSDGTTVKRKLSVIEMIFLLKAVPQERQFHHSKMESLSMRPSLSQRVSALDFPINSKKGDVLSGQKRKRSIKALDIGIEGNLVDSFLSAEQCYSLFHYYDSSKITPEFSRNQLKKICLKNVRVESNESYLTLQEKGNLNEEELAMQTASKLDKLRQIAFKYIGKAIVQTIAENKCGTVSFQGLESRLIRAYWFLITPDFRGMDIDESQRRDKLRIKIYSLIKSLHKEKGSPIDVENREEFNEYLYKRGRLEDRLNEKCPFIHSFDGNNYEAGQNYEKSLKRFLALE